MDMITTGSGNEYVVAGMTNSTEITGYPTQDVDFYLAHYWQYPNDCFLTNSSSPNSHAIMSGYNSYRKMARGSDGKIHLIYWNGFYVYYSYSVDEGASYSSWEQVCFADTLPALTLTSTNIPYIVYGINYDAGSQNQLRYYVCRRMAGGWEYSDDIYRSAPTTPNVKPCPASLALSSDTIYIAFRDNVSNTIKVAQKPMPLGNKYAPIVYQISTTGFYPAIGFDKSSLYRKPRIVVARHEPFGGYAYFHYRQVKSTTWNTLNVSGSFPCYGQPSLYLGETGIRYAYEGEYQELCGLLTRIIRWEASGYVMDPMEQAAPECDYDYNGIIGNCYVPSMDIIVYKCNSNIWYTQKTEAGWTNQVLSIDKAEESPNYPQAIYFANNLGINQLHILWTHRIDVSYYLMRKIETIGTFPLIAQEKPPSNVIAAHNNTNNDFICFVQNPIQNKLTMRLNIPASGTLKVTMYDVAGRFVRRIHDGVAAKGTRDLTCANLNLPNGIYFVMAEINNKKFTTKIIIQK